MTRDGRRGAALFVVLVFSAFLAALAAAAVRTGLSGARAAAAFADGVKADELGRGAAQVLAYRLATGGEEARRGGAVAVRLPGADVTVDYLSESARIDANFAPVPLLAALAAAAGAEPSEAEALASRVTRFRATAEARAKAAAAPSGEAAPPGGGLAALRAAVDALGPAGKPKPAAATPAIRDIAEIEEAWALPAGLARRLVPWLTVSNGTPTVDPVLAGRTVVAALLGDDERVDDYLRRRQQGFVDKDSALALLPVPVRDFVAFKDVAAVRAIARVTLADRFERRYEMVLAPAPSRAAGVGAGAGAAVDAGAGQGRSALPVVVSWRKLP